VGAGIVLRFQCRKNLDLSPGEYLTERRGQDALWCSIPQAITLNRQLYALVAKLGEKGKQSHASPSSQAPSPLSPGC